MPDDWPHGYWLKLVGLTALGIAWAFVEAKRYLRTKQWAVAALRSIGVAFYILLLIFLWTAAITGVDLRDFVGIPHR